MSTSAPLLPRARGTPTVNDPGTGALNLYLFFNIFPSHFALPLLIVTLCLTRARRNVTLINLCITWIIVGLVSCILLYSGHQTGPEPPKMLCAVEASLLYAVPPMVSTSVLALVFQIWNTLVWKPQEQTQGVVLSLILGLPYVVYFLFALIGSSISNATPDKVTRNRRFFYCSVENPTFSNIVALFAALLLIITTTLNVWIGVTLYRNSRAVKRAQWDRGVLPGGGAKPKMNADDLQQAVRVAIFGVYIFLGLSLSLISIVAPNSPLPDLVFASMGTAVFLVFGTQPRLWTGWRDAYRRWRTTHEPTLNPLSIPGSPSDYSDPEKQQTSVGSVGTSKFTSSRDEKPKSAVEDEGTVVGSPPPSRPPKMFTPSVSDASKTFAPSPVESNASSGLPRTAHDSILSDADAAVVHMAERVGLSSVDASLVGLSSIDDGLARVDVGVSSMDAHARGRSMKRLPAGPAPSTPLPAPTRPQQPRDASPQTTAALFQGARRSRERADASRPRSRSRGSSPHPRALSQPRSGSGDKTPPMPPPVRTDTGGLLPPPDAEQQSQSRWSPDTRSSQWSPGTRASSQPASDAAVENQTTSKWSPDTRSSQAVSQWSAGGAVENQNQTATQVTSQWSPDTTDTHGQEWVPATDPAWSTEAAEVGAEVEAAGREDAKTPTGRDKPLPKLRF